MKTYTPNDIYKLLGLTRKDLWTLEKSVKPSKRQDNGGCNIDGVDFRGYREYDSEKYKKLCMAALYKRLGLNLGQINKRLNNPDITEDEVYDEIIQKAEEAKENAENIIAIANLYKNIGIKDASYSVLSRKDDTNAIKKATAIIRKISETKWDFDEFIRALGLNQYPQMIGIYKEFEPYMDKEGVSDEVDKLVIKLGEYGEKELNMEKISFLVFHLSLLTLSQKYIDAIEKCTKPGLAKYISEAIALYLLIKYIGDIGGILAEAGKLNGTKLPDQNALELVKKYQKVQIKWFSSGYPEQGMQLLKGIKENIREKHDNSDSEIEAMNAIDFLIEAIKYYSKELDDLDNYDEILKELDELSKE